MSCTCLAVWSGLNGPDFDDRHANLCTQLTALLYGTENRASRRCSAARQGVIQHCPGSLLDLVKAERHLDLAAWCVGGYKFWRKTVNGTGPDLNEVQRHAECCGTFARLRRCAVTPGCCHPGSQSSTEQWGMHFGKIKVAMHWWWVTALV
ncbi:TPA: hypothetical protein ACH3X1_013674 [Trebouxia sp. C0004]